MSSKGLEVGTNKDKTQRFIASQSKKKKFQAKYHKSHHFSYWVITKKTFGIRLFYEKFSCEGSNENVFGQFEKFIKLELERLEENNQ